VSAVLGVIPVEADHHRLYAGLSRADPEAHAPAGREGHISPLLKRLHESATIEHPPSMRAFRIGGICTALVDVQRLQTADGRGYSVLESGPTAQWHYSEKSGFARLTERKWRLPAAATVRPEPEKPHANLRAAQHWAFIRQLPCVACGMAAPSEAAHVRSGVDGVLGVDVNSATRPPVVFGEPEAVSLLRTDFRTRPTMRSARVPGEHPRGASQAGIPRGL
jgi:hypothetical protein